MSHALQTAVPPVRRLRSDELNEALALQRKGKTIREISEHLLLPIKRVEQSLYWDLLRK